MAIYRNPFLSRFSDRTGLKNTIFLSMYAPQIVSRILKDERLLMPKASWVIGLPGSGKSSILRLFSIDVLIEIIKKKINYRHVYDTLYDANIFSEGNIKKIGLYIPIDEFYVEAANVQIKNINPEQLFYTIFDLRVAKQLVFSLSQLDRFKKIDSSDTLIRGIPSERLPPKIFSKDISIEGLNEKIREKEIAFAEILNSFPGSPLPENIGLHNRLSSLDLIDAQIEEGKIDFILMIDDVHELYKSQLELLKKAIEKRLSFPRWLATRKHIFSINKLLGHPTNATDEREIYTIDLDNEIINKSLFRKFIKILVDKRLTLTAALNEYNSEHIENMLIEDLVNNKEKEHNGINKQIEEAKRLLKTFMHPAEELNRIASGAITTPEETELILIKAHRAAKKKQLTLFPSLDPKDNVASKDIQAAKLFWRKRAGLPIYIGFDNIILSSNQNVEQFLRVFSAFAERLIYRVELDKTTAIEPDEQKSIFTKVVKTYMENVVSRLQYGDKIYQLIENLGNFFMNRTYESNAPHAPGVTQFALINSDLQKLENPNPNQESDKWLKELSQILTAAIANNIIVPEGSQKQGKRGSERKHIFSLNRLICILYYLPMQKGDFQTLPLNLLYQLCQESISPHEIKKQKSGQLNLWT